MTHILIFTFIGLAFAVGLYCLWVSLRVEFARVPRLLHAEGYKTAYQHAMSAAGTPPPPNRSNQHLG